MLMTADQATGMIQDALKHYRFIPENICVLEADAISPDGLKGMKAHRHDSWEFKVMFTGKVDVCLPGSDKCSLETPSLELILPGVVHLTDSRESISRDGRYFNCCFDDSRVWLGDIRRENRAGFYMEMEQVDFWAKLLGRRPENVAEEIYLCLKDDSLLRQQAASGWLRLFFSTLGLAIQIHTKDRRESAPNIAVRAREYIQHNYHRPDLSVEEVALQVRVTPNHLAGLFRSAFGVTVRKTIINTRLERATKLLNCGQYSIKEVAWLTGWKNQFYFSNSFRAAYGYPPSRHHNTHITD